VGQTVFFFPIFLRTVFILTFDFINSFGESVRPNNPSFGYFTYNSKKINLPLNLLFFFLVGGWGCSLVGLERKTTSLLLLFWSLLRLEIVKGSELSKIYIDKRNNITYLQCCWPLCTL